MIRQLTMPCAWVSMLIASGKLSDIDSLPFTRCTFRECVSYHCASPLYADMKRSVEEWQWDDPMNRAHWNTQHDALRELQEPYVYHAVRIRLSPRSMPTTDVALPLSSGETQQTSNVLSLRLSPPRSLDTSVSLYPALSSPYPDITL